MNCPACDSPEKKLLLPAEKLRAKAAVFRCVRCGSAFFEPGAWELRQDYWTAGDQETVYSNPRVLRARKRRFNDRLRLLERYAPVGTLLDIGCGRGDFLACAADRGWAVRGVEPSKSVRAVRPELDANITRSTIEDVPPDLGRFDAVTMWDVIEHVDRPAESVMKTAGLLKPGGILALETPNEHGLFKLLARLLDTVALSTFLDFVYYLPHRVSFSLEGIRRLGERAGLKMVYHGTSTTETAFAAEKVSCHYARGWTAWCVAASIPLVAACARILGLGNKLIVLMRKEK